MTVQTSTTTYDITDCKIFPLLTDTTGAASPTYGTGIDVPAISALSFDPNVVSQDLKGDGGVIIANRARVDKFMIKATYGKLDLDILAALFGGAVTPGASFTDWDFQPGTQLPLFGIAFEIPDTDIDQGVADLNGWAYKCRVTGGTWLTQATDAFGQPTMDITCYKVNSSLTRATKFRLSAAQTPISVMI